MFNFSKAHTYGLFDTPLNKKILAELSAQAIDTVIFPQITTREVENPDFSFNHPDYFDWLVFPDVYTADYFVKALEKSGVDLFEIDVLRVCAVGEAVADRLRFSQLHADVIPSTRMTSDVVQALKDYILAEDEFENLRFLVLREQATGFGIADALKKLNSEVTELGIYQAEIDENRHFAKPRALLKGGAVDEFIFSSPLDVINLAHIFQTENLDEVLAGIKLNALDNQTLQMLQEFRLL